MNKKKTRIQADLMMIVNSIRRNFILDKARGDRIPSETDLIERVSGLEKTTITRSGIRRALEYLRDVDEIESIDHKGHVVTNGTFTKLKLHSTLVPLHHHFHISKFDLDENDEPIDRWITDFLHMPVSMKPIQFTSTRHDTALDEKICIISRHYLNPQGIEVTDLLEEIHERKSMTSALAKQGIEWQRRSTGVKSRLPTKTEQNLLSIGRYDPVLETTGLNFDKISNQPVELTISIFPGHRWDHVFYFDENN